MSPKVATNFWRSAGLSYLQYVNVASRALRHSLKEPAKGKALSREFVFYNKTINDVKVGVHSSIPK